MKIKGLVFDFDGLILDTETPEYNVLQGVFQTYGATLPLSEYSAALGSSFEAFDPFVYLEEKIKRPVDHKALYRDYKERSLDIIKQQPLLPGVTQIMERAIQLSLKLSVASSSPHAWVSSHLVRLGLLDKFDFILTAEDVAHIKPNPELYLKSVQKMGIKPEEAIAFEDSPNGIQAARSAGLFCVAVPNPITLQLGTDHADMVIDSLLSLTLDSLLQRAARRDL
ncbi:MAG TPA: HAD-IA family hydrolase [Anaerolineaceae bacterium]|nr:HAD-IA family hydrolase [Anaerolineaceae bacterium]